MLGVLAEMVAESVTEWPPPYSVTEELTLRGARLVLRYAAGEIGLQRRQSVKNRASRLAAELEPIRGFARSGLAIHVCDLLNAVRCLICEGPWPGAIDHESAKCLHRVYAAINELTKASVREHRDRIIMKWCFRDAGGRPGKCKQGKLRAAFEACWLADEPEAAYELVKHS
jgi:hypothetical protein